MWQSRVEIEHYSVAYFDRVTAFKVLSHKTSVKGMAHMCQTYQVFMHLRCMYELRP